MYSTLQENTKLSPAKVNLLKTTTKILKSNAWDSSSNQVSNQKTQLHINIITFNWPHKSYWSCWRRDKVWRPPVRPSIPWPSWSWGRRSLSSRKKPEPQIHPFPQTTNWILQKDYVCFWWFYVQIKSFIQKKMTAAKLWMHYKLFYSKTLLKLVSCDSDGF